MHSYAFQGDTPTLSYTHCMQKYAFLCILVQHFDCLLTINVFLVHSYTLQTNPMRSAGVFEATYYFLIPSKTYHTVPIRSDGEVLQLVWNKSTFLHARCVYAAIQTPDQYWWNDFLKTLKGRSKCKCVVFGTRPYIVALMCIIFWFFILVVVL